LFDEHINISPEDKTLAHERILLAQADFILFADISYDSRVFALAHERLAVYQGRLFYRWAVLVISVAFLLLVWFFFSLLMPYWLVYVSHVEDRFFNTSRL
jgi:hypothetical protein